MFTFAIAIWQSNTYNLIFELFQGKNFAKQKQIILLTFVTCADIVSTLHGI
jgi:hypothetical protein